MTSQQYSRKSYGIKNRMESATCKTSIQPSLLLLISKCKLHCFYIRRRQIKFLSLTLTKINTAQNSGNFNKTLMTITHTRGNQILVSCLSAYGKYIPNPNYLQMGEKKKHHQEKHHQTKQNNQTEGGTQMPVTKAITYTCMNPL